jgi:hypothetical protein
MNLISYLELIQTNSNSIFGKVERFDNYKKLEEQPLLKAFLDDNDLQEITICSSNIGFVNTYRKFYLKDKEWVENRIKELEKENEC